MIVRYNIPFAELWAGSEQKLMGNSLVRVASIEHLVRSKRLTSRPLDLSDIEGLLAFKEI